MKLCPAFRGSICRLIRNCPLQLLHQLHSAPGLGLHSVAPGTPCFLLRVLAVIGVGRLLSFIDDLLEPIPGLLSVSVGTFAFVGGSPAPGANRGSRGVLVAASMADHDWPSRLLPRGFGVNIGLCSTSRRAENTVRRGRGLCLDLSPTSLMSPLHSRRVPAFPRDNEGLQCRSRGPASQCVSLHCC